jgi:diadenosine tetraphosphate (Ap4A) HIT family hydrolase
MCALGNVVPQLHLHVIGRSKYDRAWPGPIWGIGPITYDEEQACVAVERFKTALQGRLR